MWSAVFTPPRSVRSHGLASVSSRWGLRKRSDLKAALRKTLPIKGFAEVFIGNLDHLLLERRVCNQRIQFALVGRTVHGQVYITALQRGVENRIGQFH